MISTQLRSADQSLAGWVESYSQLKTARSLVKLAGPKATLVMRQDVDRLRLVAERALKHLQSDVNAVTTAAPQSAVA